MSDDLLIILKKLFSVICFLEPSTLRIILLLRSKALFEDLVSKELLRWPSVDDGERIEFQEESFSLFALRVFEEHREFTWLEGSKGVNDLLSHFDVLLDKLVVQHCFLLQVSVGAVLHDASVEICQDLVHFRRSLEEQLRTGYQQVFLHFYCVRHFLFFDHLLKNVRRVVNLFSKLALDPHKCGAAAVVSNLFQSLAGEEGKE